MVEQEEGPVATLRTIPDVVEQAALRRGDSLALVDGGERMTFAGLSAAVRQCAGAMVAAGVDRGDRIAIQAPNSIRFVVAALGAMSVGGVLVPLNTRYKGEETRWILERSGASMLITYNGFLGNDYLAMLDRAGDRPPTLRRTVTLAGAGGQPWAEFLDEGTGHKAAATTRLAQVAGEDLSDMFFTSGTTGRPKGVCTTHSQNIRVYEAWAAGVGLKAGDRYLLINPMFHTFGWKAGVLACLLQGATLITQQTFDVTETLQLIEQERVTVLPGPPTLYASILDHDGRAGADLGSLRLAVTGASVVPVALVRRMRAELFPKVVIAYGLTESSGTATVGDPDADDDTIAHTVGRPIAGTEVIIGDAHGRALPAGQSGEVLVRGYNVMQGYFDDPVGTSEAIDQAGYLHTGDIGAMDADGTLRITDRLKDMFVVGGFNVYPAEIEQVLCRHPAVSEVAVVGMADGRLGEVGCAFVILRVGAVVTEAEIVAFCRERLANFKVPRSVRFVPELPRNASGKVMKAVLRSDIGAFSDPLPS